MTNEAERAQAQHTAQAMRAAAIRVATKRALGESDPTLAYGCVDWFRYDAVPQPREADPARAAAAARGGAAAGDAARSH